MQIVQSARAVNPVFGNGVTWGLIFTYCTLLATPLWLWFRLPKRTLPPATTEGADYDRFLLDFKKRLARHPRLRGLALNSTMDIEAALQTLDKQADDVVTSTASAVFLSTAVLQSGRLDVLVVLRQPKGVSARGARQPCCASSAIDQDHHQPPRFMRQEDFRENSKSVFLDNIQRIHWATLSRYVREAIPQF